MTENRISSVDLVAAVRAYVEQFRSRIPLKGLRRVEEALANPISVDQWMHGLNKVVHAVMSAASAPLHCTESLGYEHINGINEVVEAGIVTTRNGQRQLALCYSTLSTSSPFQIKRAVFFLVEFMLAEFMLLTPSVGDGVADLLIDWKEKALTEAVEAMSPEALKDYSHSEWTFLLAMIENLRRFTLQFEKESVGNSSEHFKKRENILRLAADAILCRVNAEAERKQINISDPTKTAFRGIYFYLNQFDKEEAWKSSSLLLVPLLQIEEEDWKKLLGKIEIEIGKLEFSDQIFAYILSNLRAIF